MIPPSSWLVVQGEGHVQVELGTERGGSRVILTSCSPESTSRRRISMRPSRRSVYKSPMRLVTRPRWEFTHLVKVFFCTASRSSARTNTGEKEKRGVGVEVDLHRQGYNWLPWLRLHWHQYQCCQGEWIFRINLSVNKHQQTDYLDPPWEHTGDSKSYKLLKPLSRAVHFTDKLCH